MVSVNTIKEIILKNRVEVDFYIPEEEIAIQACYDFADSDITRQREIGALENLNQRFPCQRNIIVTREMNTTINSDGLSIEVMSLSNFLLSC